MMRRSVFAIACAACAVTLVACGGNSPDAAKTAAPATPAAAPAAAPAPKPAGVVTLTEPIEGAMGGHIDHFAWQPVAGADGYVIKIVAVTGNRTVWESQPLTTTEVTLPATVALEPEVHTWTVTAKKGSETLATSATQKFTITP
jgi:hypothetical protein